MLLYSTLLSINDTLTKDGFIRLVIEWNKKSPYETNVIRNLVWNGERNVRYGDEKLWLSIEEYRNKNIIAIRYEKVAEDGAIWDTDYVMNFDEMRMAIQLDRSYKEEALLADTKFSTPHFISMLIEGGYLKEDEDFAVTNKPLMITEGNLELVNAVIKGQVKCRLPVIYVSKTINDEEPIEVRWLLSKLKGMSHVLLQEQVSTNKELRKICQGKNEQYGAIGIYYPNATARHEKYLYHRESGYDTLLLEKVVRSVMRYNNMQNISQLYTWQGVNAALLSDRLAKQSEERVAAEKAKHEAEEEVDNVYAAFDEDLRELQRQVAELAKANEALRYENQGLRTKIQSTDAVPILCMGEEDELYQGEIKDIILAALEEALKGTKDKSRRADVIRDVIAANDYGNLGEQRQQRIKGLLKAYDGMSKILRQELNELGFEITEEGKHYKITYYGDRRYWTTLPKTPSDHRDGKNAALTICRDML